MSTVLQAHQLTLHDVKTRLGLQRSTDSNFFWEWQQELPKLSSAEQGWLNQVKADFLGLEEYPLHEEIVKLTVLAPLMSLAGFFRRPFYPQAEVQIELAVEDSNEIVKGRLDVLVLQQQLWGVVIETKRKQLSLSAALPQALTYMTRSPSRPVFGFLTNGSDFQFVKLAQGSYSLSDKFTLERQENELYQVLKILRRLGQVITGGGVAVAL